MEQLIIKAELAARNVRFKMWLELLNDFIQDGN